MRTLFIYSICKKPINDIKEHFKNEYDFILKDRSVIKYIVKNIDVRLIGKGSYIAPIDMITERVMVDDETYNLFMDIVEQSGMTNLRQEAVLSAFLLHYAKIITG